MPDIFRGQSVDKTEIRIYIYRCPAISYQINQIPASEKQKSGLRLCIFQKKFLRDGLALNSHKIIILPHAGKKIHAAIPHNGFRV